VSNCSPMVSLTHSKASWACTISYFDWIYRSKREILCQIIQWIVFWPTFSHAALAKPDFWARITLFIVRFFFSLDTDRKLTRWMWCRNLTILFSLSRIDYIHTHIWIKTVRERERKRLMCRRFNHVTMCMWIEKINAKHFFL
jgi:hypothetical protein